MKPDVAAERTEVEMEKFNASMHRLGAIAGNGIGKAVREGAVLFAQSAARATPPDAGKAISAKRFKRVIKAEPYVMNGSTKIHLNPEKYLSGLRPRGRGVKADYLVLMKRPHSRRFKAILFDSLAKAREKQTISTRGLLRAGWWGALGKLGASAVEKFGKAVPNLLPRISRISETVQPDSVEISIGNCVNGYDDLKKQVIPVALMKAGNRMNAIANKLAADAVRKAG
jgi:hypothetical protein